ncbi:MAG: FtsX-like permease family protein [Bacteroidetes bacterium]|nr:FtsX-like permease family protein [Bacteroidota bacterium]
MMFDLESEIQNWIKGLRSNPSFEDGDIEEIEIHIRDSIESNIYKGSSPEESFKHAAASFGQLDLAGDEFIKSRTAGMKMPKKDVLAHNYSSSTNPITDQLIMFSNYTRKVLRIIRQNKVLSFINILGMAIGLAASGIILSFVHQEYHFDSSLRASEKIFRIIQKEGETENLNTYAPLAEALNEELPEIEASIRLAFYYGFLPCRAGENSYNERSAIFADPSFFNFFSFPLLHGDPENCLPDRNSVAISESSAQKYFGINNPLGKQLDIGHEKKFTVTAVYRKFPVNSNFRGDFILPLECISDLTQIWIEPSWDYESDINTFVLLSGEVIGPELTAKTRTLLSRHLDNNHMELLFQPLSEIHTNKSLGWGSNPQISIRILRILSLVAFLLLGVSTINFLFLYIGIVSQRTTGIGIKKVFGASRRVLFREYFNEVSTLMFCSLLLASGITLFYLEVLVPAFSLPDLVYMDVSLVLSLLFILIVVDLLAGIYPSLILSSKKALTLFQAMKEEYPFKYKALPILSIVQFSLFISLLAFNLLLHKQTHFLTNKETGYARKELITIPMNMPLGQGIHGEQFGTFVQEMKKLPTIDQVTASFSSPANAGASTGGVSWEGQMDDRKLKVGWSWESVSFDYFETLGVNILHGRGFNQDFHSDEVNWETRECAYIINESGLREMGMDDPIGETFSVWGFKGPIVGVVEDYHARSMHSEMRPMFYILDPVFWNKIVIRLNPGKNDHIEGIQKVWEQFGDDYPLEINHVDDQIKSLYAHETGLTNTLTLFSLLTIVVIGIGLITLSLLSFNRRKKEIGIRKVNGATSMEILRMMNKQYTRYVLLSFLIAILPAWYYMQRWLANYAYKTKISWWIFFAAGSVTLLIALLTTSWKSWQAASKNPVESLRSE